MCFRKMQNKVQFPPEKGWAVLDEDDFFTYMAEEPLETYEANILVKLTEQGALEGSFRVVLGGQSLVRAQIHACHMLPITGAEHFRLTIERKPIDIFFRRNGLTSDWVDTDQRDTLSI